ncbi:hypothetical protein [Ralstonia phage RSP15]|uniref:hypothetical protein n=1 Tax=Ralstonia phage RSP15 TaxID=1785960 RepID=UPI00074D36F7|nr:hypothetical protein BH754_gp128 [Ralstonia phage RSP15]BAU40178.1 hypothetical protein [Ralstonia phage RSP15]
MLDATELERQRDLLIDAIRNAAIKVGIARSDVYVGGPMALMLLDDMVQYIEHLKKNQNTNPSFDFCTEGDNCMCGGDAKGVRETCPNWRKSQ